MQHSIDPIILVVDKDETVRQTLWDALSPLNYRVLEAPTAAKGLALVRSFKPALVLTDVYLPDMDGMDFIRKVRADNESLVVVVSAASSLNSVIAALDAGADDFIPTPFSMGELVARVRVALRHASVNQEILNRTFQAGDLEVDFKERRVRISGKNVHLTPLEYRILSMLIDNAGRVLPYDRLLRAWTTRKRRHLSHIRVLMCQLRRKLEVDPAKPRHLVTASGIGYQFQLRGQ
jgi:two-component system, OmpR family, KDP operon response regulator KdpE